MLKHKDQQAIIIKGTLQNNLVTSGEEKVYYSVMKVDMNLFMWFMLVIVKDSTLA
jgi:hypothetical protein